MRYALCLTTYRLTFFGCLSVTQPLYWIPFLRRYQLFDSYFCLCVLICHVIAMDGSLMPVSNFFLLLNKELFARLKSPTTVYQDTKVFVKLKPRSDIQIEIKRGNGILPLRH